MFDSVKKYAQKEKTKLEDEESIAPRIGVNP
jgi:hypothetical protein